MTKPGPRGGAAIVAGAGLGLGLLAGWLALWRLLSDAAGWFAPATLAVGLAGWLLAGAPPARRRPLLRRGLRTAGGGAAGLAVAASLSLGAFLPPGSAAWVSPPLGRFGGHLALASLALALGLAVATGAATAWRGRALDAMTLAGLAAAWVWAQTGRQASFPTPPTTAAILAPRLAVILALGTICAVGATLQWWRSRRATRAGRRLGPVGATLGRWLWRWAGAGALLGLAVGLGAGVAGWWRFAILAAVVAALAPGRRLGRGAAVVAPLARGAAWLAPVALAGALVYFATSEDLEVVLLRNTAERRALAAWRGAFGDERRGAPAPGALAGLVRDGAGRPLAGADVVLADARGGVYSAASGPDGRYRLDGVPVGNYLPLAVAPGHAPAPASGVGGRGRVATVRAGRTAAGVDFSLAPRPPLDPRANDSLRLDPPAEITIESLEASTVRRRQFIFANRGLTLDGGLVHEPGAAAGPGPFPILVTIYPGEARSWEGVSAPLAARGYVVVSYFPRRLLDLEGDLDDLRLLLNLARAGQFSARGDPASVALVGGSVSTVYTYALARSLAGSPVGEGVRAAVQYGGLFDLFAFRRSWEEGRVAIDPGISALEYLLVAFGRPDTRPELYLRLSPRYGLGPGDLPPTLLVHTERDTIVPPEQSQLAADALARLAIPRRLLLYPDLEHYLDVSRRDPAQLDMLEQTVAFLRRYTGR